MHAVRLSTSPGLLASTSPSTTSAWMPDGSIYGFLGPTAPARRRTHDHASCTPIAGNIRVLGCWARLGTDEVSYLPEERGLYKQMKVGEVLPILRGAQGHGPQRPARRSSSGSIAWAWRNGRRRTSRRSPRAWRAEVQFVAAVIASKLGAARRAVQRARSRERRAAREAVLDLKQRHHRHLLHATWPSPRRFATSLFMIYKGQQGPRRHARIDQGARRDTLRVRLDKNGTAFDGLPGVLRAQHRPLPGIASGARRRPAAGAAALMGRGRVLHFELTRPSLHEIFVHRRARRRRDRRATPALAAGENHRDTETQRRQETEITMESREARKGESSSPPRSFTKLS